MNIQCLRCKGRGYCGRKVCAQQVRISSKRSFNQKAKQDYFGDSPNLFVGRYGYPDINVGLLSTESYNSHDDPKGWYEKKYSIPEISDLRSELVNSTFKMNVKSFDSRFSEMAQEISMAKKPVDIEVHLKKKPQFSISYSQDITPFGPSVELEKADLAENTKIPRAVDKVTSDYDLRSAGAIRYLAKKGYGEHYLTKLISAGTLGVKGQRKYVPTRWSITAIDDQVGKIIKDEIMDFNEMHYSAFFGSHLGNYFLVLVFPDAFSYELFENYVSPDGKVYEPTTDHESPKGRKNYANNTAGGYYAARLAVLEGLRQRKRRGSCLVIRFITNEYSNPLGVWVVRQATRDAMSRKPIEFGSKELMLQYAAMLAKKKFGFDLQPIIKRSILLREMRTQRKLGEWSA